MSNYTLCDESKLVKIILIIIMIIVLQRKNNSPLK